MLPPTHCTRSCRSRGAWRHRCAPSHAHEPRQHLWVELLHAGDGRQLHRGDVLQIHYACKLARTGGCVDSSRSKVGTARTPLALTLGQQQVVPGMEAGLAVLSLGALARLHVPAPLGYGDSGTGVIPPRAPLLFEVEILSVNGRRAAGLPMPRLRRLLALPSPAEAADVPFEAGRLARVHADTARAVAAAAAAGSGAADDEMAAEEEEEEEEEDVRAALAQIEIAVAGPAAAASAASSSASASASSQLLAAPAWVRQLRSRLPLPTPEVGHVLSFLEELRGAAWAEAALGGGELPWASPVVGCEGPGSNRLGL